MIKVEKEVIAVDVIILSFAKNQKLQELTQQTIDTLLQSEDKKNIEFNVVVIESNINLFPFQFPFTTTIYPKEKFGFHKYLNIGIKNTSNKFICLCNNDLIFHKGWATNILLEMEKDLALISANPYCPISHKNNGIPNNGTNIYSTNNGILIGWCLFMKRDVFSIIGDLDEYIEFWYSDNDYGNTLKKHHIKHALITNSKVTHLGSQSHDLLTEKEKFNFSYGQFLYFDYKWNHESKILFSIKKKILPIFQYFFLNKNFNLIYSLTTRLLAKIFGGLK